MTDSKPVPLHSKWVGVTYTYNGSLRSELHRQIDDHRAWTVPEIQEHFKLVDIKAATVTREWLNAQLLFWGFVEPGVPNKMKMDNMIAILRTQLPDPLPPYDRRARYPHSGLKEVFDDLKTRWLNAHPKYRAPMLKQHAAQKRCHEAADDPSTTELRNKKIRVSSPSIDNGEGPSSGGFHPTQQTAHPAVKPTGKEGKSSSPVSQLTNRQPIVRAVKSGLREEIVPNLSPTWVNLLQKVERFERHSYMLSISGSYVLRCPDLEDRYPGLEGKLSIEIENNLTYATHNGVFQARLDLGVFEGTAMLGTDRIRLSRCLWEKAKNDLERVPNSATRDEETRRLHDEAYDAEGELISSRLAPPISVDISQPPKLFFQFRVEDKHGLFNNNGMCFSDRGAISFADIRCLRLDGSIHLPMISDAKIPFVGFKVSQKPRSLPRSWSSFPACAVRFGTAWRER